MKSDQVATELKAILVTMLKSTHDRIIFSIMTLYFCSEIAATIILKRPITPVGLCLEVPIMILPLLVSAFNQFRVHSQSEFKKLEGVGLRTIAEVIAVEKYGQEYKIKGNVTYQYSIAGITYKNQSSIYTMQDLNRMPIGASVKIVYAAGDPQLSIVRSTLDHKKGDISGILILSVMVGFLFLAISIANIQAIAQNILH